MKKVLVTGVNGQLGHDVVKRLAQEKDVYVVSGADLQDFDITDMGQTGAFIKEFRPDIVVHCSAYTAVDKAESEADKCRAVNVQGSHNIAQACAAIHAVMVYISTDYVYGGQGDNPFEVSDPTAPLSVYGKTKLDGEETCRRLLEKIFIIRTSWVFGKNGNNFVKTMLRLGAERDVLNVVSDQIGSPTYTVDLADFIRFLIGTEQYGVYHFSNEGFCSWYDFAQEIFKQAGVHVKVNGIPTSEYKTAAIRPFNSRLSKKTVYDAGYCTIPDWRDALKRYLEELTT